MRHRFPTILVTVALAGSAACGGGGSSSGGGGSTTPTSPTSTNSAPVITNITINPAFGIQDLSAFAMTATATDANNDTLTYTWDFGDGTTGTGATQNKTYTSGGAKTVRLTVSDGRTVTTEYRTATATDTRTINVGSMTGTWLLTLVPGCYNTSLNNTFLLTLTQTGTKVEGTMSVPNGFCNVPKEPTGKTDPAEPGTINAAGYVQIRIKVGIYVDFYFRGTMQSPGTTVAGGSFNSGFAGENTTLVKQ